MSSQRDSERRMHPTYKSWTAGISAQTKSVAKAGTCKYCTLLGHINDLKYHTSVLNGYFD